MTSLNSGLPRLAAASCLWLLAAPLLSAAEPQQESPPAAAHESGESLEVQLAKARLQLAKVELERALTANQKQHPVFSPVTVHLLQRNVEVAEARLDALKDPAQRDLHASHLRQLESALKIAEHRWSSAARMRERSPGLIDDARFEALRLRVEVARLALARAKESDVVTTPIDHMRWELDQMRQVILDLTLHMEELASKP